MEHFSNLKNELDNQIIEETVWSKRIQNKLNKIQYESIANELRKYIKCLKRKDQAGPDKSSSCC